jgi:hypothetical protein
MPFKPWQEHVMNNGVCGRCGLPLPYPEALFSHHYTDGKPVYSPKPAGRTAPCQPSTDK